MNRSTRSFCTRRAFRFWPDAAWRDVVFAISVGAIVLALAIIIGPAALGSKADPTNLNADPRPDWYFLWAIATALRWWGTIPVKKSVSICAVPESGAGPVANAGLTNTIASASAAQKREQTKCASQMSHTLAYHTTSRRPNTGAT
jgi:hypothetical protein